MPSTVSDVSEFDALVGAMFGPGRGVVEISSGATPVETMEQIAARHGRRIFMSTATALYNEQYPERAIGTFDACAAAQARGNELYIQITCQPLSFDFTLIGPELLRRARQLSRSGGQETVEHRHRRRSHRARPLSANAAWPPSRPSSPA